jgi:putative FmdB family regulatory protein
MPIYEYRCLECGSVFEKIVPLNSGSISCQKCASPRVEKLFSTFAVAVPENHSNAHEAAPGPCNTCGAAKQGMCRMMD